MRLSNYDGNITSSIDSARANRGNVYSVSSPSGMTLTVAVCGHEHWNPYAAVSYQLAESTIGKVSCVTIAPFQQP